MYLGVMMKLFTLFCMLLVSTTLSAQKQYFLPTGDSSLDEKERPLIEVYLPNQKLDTASRVKVPKATTPHHE